LSKIEFTRDGYKHFSNNVKSYYFERLYKHKKHVLMRLWIQYIGMTSIIAWDSCWMLKQFS